MYLTYATVMYSQRSKTSSEIYIFHAYHPDADPGGARSKGWLSGRLLPGIAGSNTAGDTKVCLLCVLCVVR